MATVNGKYMSDSKAKAYYQAQANSAELEQEDLKAQIETEKEQLHKYKQELKECKEKANEKLQDITQMVADYGIEELPILSDAMVDMYPDRAEQDKRYHEIYDHLTEYLN